MNLFSQPRFSFRSGDEVAGFKLLFPAGCGSSGEVYLAEDASGKRFALKISPGKRELPGITAYRDLPAHDALAMIYAAGKLPDGRIYLLMEAADNRADKGGYEPDTLASRIARGPLKAEEALTVFLTLLDGIKLLHERHLIHGDVKPENVIFCAGKAKLTDFGTLAGAGEVAGGTADFLPPECFDGTKSPEATEENDLYAMGKLLYCLFSGRAPTEFPTPPFHADAAEFKLMRPFYAKACHAKKAYRFHSAGEMEKAAKRLLAQLRPRPHRFRRKWCVIAGLSLMALLLFFFAGRIFLTSHPLPTQVLAPENKELLSSPELYLTPEITARVRQIVASAPHTPPRAAEGEIAFCWSQIEDECHWQRMDLKGRKKLAERLLRALEQYDSR